MRAEPKVWEYLDGRPPRLQWGPGARYAFVECVVTHPPSSEGRTVYVLLEGDMVTKLLLELRALAIAQRSTPESAAVVDASGGNNVD